MSDADGLPGRPSGRAGGVARTALGADDAAARLRDEGWSVGVVRGGATTAAFLDAVGTALDFPDRYGRNLDALWDCLGDVAVATALVWEGWQELAVGAPDAWADAMSLLRERAGDGAPFCVVLADAPPGRVRS